MAELQNFRFKGNTEPVKCNDYGDDEDLIFVKKIHIPKIGAETLREVKEQGIPLFKEKEEARVIGLLMNAYQDCDGIDMYIYMSTGGCCIQCGNDNAVVVAYSRKHDESFLISFASPFVEAKFGEIIQKRRK